MGDIHLDSPFAAKDPKSAAQRRRELRECFSAAMTGARVAGAQLILISGDVFDSEFVTADTVELVMTEFQRAQVPVIVAPGNHDPADGRSVWNRCRFSDNVFIFKEESITRFCFDDIGVDVYGYAFTSPQLSRSPVAGEFVRNTDRVNILLCHGDISSPVSKDAPISPEQIEAFGADYTALGHIHNGEKYSGKAGKCTFAYPGCLMGRDFGECGKKSAIIADIGKEGNVNIERRRFSRKHYEDVTLSVDGAVSASDIYAATTDVCRDMDGDTVLRLTLSGSVDPDVRIDCDLIEASLSRLSEVTVRDRTAPSLSFAEGDMTVRGEYCRLLAPMLRSADPVERERAILALKMGLAALSGNEL